MAARGIAIDQPAMGPPFLSLGYHEHRQDGEAAVGLTRGIRARTDVRRVGIGPHPPGPSHPGGSPDAAPITTTAVPPPFSNRSERK